MRTIKDEYRRFAKGTRLEEMEGGLPDYVESVFYAGITCALNMLDISESDSTVGRAVVLCRELQEFAINSRNDIKSRNARPKEPST